MTVVDFVILLLLLIHLFLISQILYDWAAPVKSIHYELKWSSLYSFIIKIKGGTMSQIVILKPGQSVEGTLIPTDELGRIAKIQSGSFRLEGFNPDTVSVTAIEVEDGSLVIKLTGLADTGRTDGFLVFDGDVDEDVNEVKIPLSVVGDNWSAVSAKVEFGPIQNPIVETKTPIANEEVPTSSEPIEELTKSEEETFENKEPSFPTEDTSKSTFEDNKGSISLTSKATKKKG